MQKILIRRIVASLILSVMLFALPVGAFLANSSTAVQVFAEDDVSGNETDGDGKAGENNDDNSGDESDEGGETWRPEKKERRNRLLLRSQNRSASVTANAASMIIMMIVLYAAWIIPSVSM